MNRNDIRTVVAAATGTGVMIGALFVLSELDPWSKLTRARARHQLTDTERAELNRAVADKHQRDLDSMRDSQAREARRAHIRGKFDPALFAGITEARTPADLTVDELIAAVEHTKTMQHRQWSWSQNGPVADDALTDWNEQLIALREEFTDRRWSHMSQRKVSEVDRLRLEAADPRVNDYTPWPDITTTTDVDSADTGVAAEVAEGAEQR